MRAEEGRKRRAMIAATLMLLAQNREFYALDTVHSPFSLTRFALTNVDAIVTLRGVRSGVSGHDRETSSYSVPRGR